MNKQDIYSLLEEKFLGYLDLIEVPVEPNHEKMINIQEGHGLKVRQIDVNMYPVSGNEIFVRESVCKMLLKAKDILLAYDPDFQLEIVYGYRTFEIQSNLFEKQKILLKKKLTGTELLSAVHKFIAVPEVAGHPTGGAVDVQILKKGTPITFGTSIWQFHEDSFTFSPFVDIEAWNNRQLLRRIMMQVGFAPFDGEWWHFSYGDKEWAKYYGQKAAIYEQLRQNELSVLIPSDRGG